MVKWVGVAAFGVEGLERVTDGLCTNGPFQASALCTCGRDVVSSSTVPYVFFPKSEGENDGLAEWSIICDRSCASPCGPMGFKRTMQIPPSSDKSWAALRTFLSVGLDVNNRIFWCRRAGSVKSFDSILSASMIRISASARLLSSTVVYHLINCWCRYWAKLQEPGLSMRKPTNATDGKFWPQTRAGGGSNGERTDPGTSGASNWINIWVPFPTSDWTSIEPFIPGDLRRACTLGFLVASLGLDRDLPIARPSPTPWAKGFSCEKGWKSLSRIKVADMPGPVSSMAITIGMDEGSFWLPWESLSLI